MSRLIPVAALVGITALWGWTFVIVRDAVSGFPVLPFLAIRFTLAALVLAPAVKVPRDVRSGLAPGLALSAGYLCQTEGLRYTSASRAGLLTGLFIVITPVLVFALGRRPPSLVTAIAIPVALLGTLLLAATGGSTGNHEAIGDALEVLTAIAFSVHILLLSRVPRGANALSVALGQMVVAAVGFGAASAIVRDVPTPAESVWTAALLTGVLASAVAFWIQTLVQQRISPNRTAVILTCEPAFAMLFGVVLAGDRFTVLQAAGAALILGALGLHEGWPALMESRRAAVT